MGSTLCVKHTPSAVRRTLFRNALMGTVGLPGLVTVPLRGWRYVDMAFESKAVAARERTVLKVATLLPSFAFGGFFAYVLILGATVGTGPR